MDRTPLILFDLDSTITRCEILPLLAREAGIEAQMRERTERSMRGETRFSEDFPERALLLKEIPLSRAREIVASAPLNPRIAAFVRTHAGQCRILTGNLDVWISDLIDQLGMRGRCLSSVAATDGDRLTGVRQVLNKAEAARCFPAPFWAVGDGDNDAEMLRLAEVGIGYGGSRTLPDSVRQAAKRLFFDEESLCDFLETALRGE